MRQLILVLVLLAAEVLNVTPEEAKQVATRLDLLEHNMRVMAQWVGNGPRAGFVLSADAQGRLQIVPASEPPYNPASEASVTPGGGGAP